MRISITNKARERYVKHVIEDSYRETRSIRDIERIFEDSLSRHRCYEHLEKLVGRSDFRIKLKLLDLDGTDFGTYPVVFIKRNGKNAYRLITILDENLN